MSMGWLIEQVGANVHVRPYLDVIEHDKSHKCVCRPRWRAQRATDSIVWVFTHNSVDGREARE